MGKFQYKIKNLATGKYWSGYASKSTWLQEVAAVNAMHEAIQRWGFANTAFVKIPLDQEIIIPAKSYLQNKEAEELNEDVVINKLIKAIDISHRKIGTKNIEEFRSLILHNIRQEFSGRIRDITAGVSFVENIFYIKTVLSLKSKYDDAEYQYHKLHMIKDTNWQVNVAAEELRIENSEKKRAQKELELYLTLKQKYQK